MRSPHIRRKISADGNSKNPARSEDTDTRASTSVKTENIFMDFTTACKGFPEKLSGVIATTVNWVGFGSKEHGLVMFRKFVLDIRARGICEDEAPEFFILKV